MSVAYFSMEIALEERIPTYSGGLGMLAGDTLRAAADLALPIVGVTLAYAQGYFRQTLDAHGNQSESTDPWTIADLLTSTGASVSVRIADHDVRIIAWRYDVTGHDGAIVPVYLLDTNVPENTPEDRAITASLYGGDTRYRLTQEIVLGIGGVRILEALGHRSIATYHMNEGHAALIALELLHRAPVAHGADPLDAVRRHCVFTTHTPVPAGHDRFGEDLVRALLGDADAQRLCDLGIIHDHCLNMTELALRASRFANAVAMKHGEVSRAMFPGYAIAAITNGVHAGTWAAPQIAPLFDRYIPDWRSDSVQLRQAFGIPLGELAQAHHAAKAALVAAVAERTGVVLRDDRFTIGYARRAAAYKRADLLFRDPAKLRALAARVGRLQIVYGGKAHPHDEDGKAKIRTVFAAGEQLSDFADVVYVPNYEMGLAKLMVAGVDVWLNTPEPPLEASGTSGMKAAMNGVPQLSILDGWWIEGNVEGRTGWSIDAAHPENLYGKLAEIAACVAEPAAYAQVMQYAIAVNGAHFNTHRMVRQYAQHAYGLVSDECRPRTMRTGAAAS